MLRRMYTAFICARKPTPTTEEGEELPLTRGSCQVASRRQLAMVGVLHAVDLVAVAIRRRILINAVMSSRKNYWNHE